MCTRPVEALICVGSLSVYVDLDVRKGVEFENEKANLIKKFIEKNKNEFNPGELTLISKLKKSS